MEPDAHEDAIPRLRNHSGLTRLIRVHELAGRGDQPKLLNYHIDIDAKGFHPTSVGVTGWISPTPPIPKVGGVTYDYEGLAELAAETAMLFPGEAVVRITASPGISLGVLANTIIALRGPECRIATVLEEDDERCWMWTPIVDLPDQAARTRLAALLMTRGLGPWDAMWSSMEQPSPRERTSHEDRLAAWSNRRYDRAAPRWMPRPN